MARIDSSSVRERSQQGFTLVEVLIVIVVIGVLSTVVIFAVRAIVDRGERASCAIDRRVLATAVDTYFGENQTREILATGSTADGERYERTLVEAGRLGELSQLHNLNSDGSIIIIDSSCI
jgi:prepilin-type N-terminal cleavage/methylation domain-containing protein